MLVPSTELGRWSIGLIVVFAAGLSFFSIAVAAGQRGGEGFFDNMVLTGPMLVAYACAVAATVTGLMAVLGRGERAVVVFGAIVVGGLVTLYGILEVAVPH